MTWVVRPCNKSKDEARFGNSPAAAGLLWIDRGAQMQPLCWSQLSMTDCADNVVWAIAKLVDVVMYVPRALHETASNDPVHKGRHLPRLWL